MELHSNTFVSCAYHTRILELWPKLSPVLITRPERLFWLKQNCFKTVLKLFLILVLFKFYLKCADSFSHRSAAVLQYMLANPA